MLPLASSKAISSSVAMQASQSWRRWTGPAESRTPGVDCRGGSDRTVNRIKLNRIELNQIDSFVALNRIIFFFAESPITNGNLDAYLLEQLCQISFQSNLKKKTSPNTNNKMCDQLLIKNVQTDMELTVTFIQTPILA